MWMVMKLIEWTASFSGASSLANSGADILTGAVMPFLDLNCDVPQPLDVWFLFRQCCATGVTLFSDFAQSTWATAKDDLAIVVLRGQKLRCGRNIVGAYSIGAEIFVPATWLHSTSLFSSSLVELCLLL